MRIKKIKIKMYLVYNKKINCFNIQGQRRSYYDPTLRMTKNYLLKLIIEHLKNTDMELVSSLIKIHIELAKDFDVQQLTMIESTFRMYESKLGSCCQLYIKGNVYQHNTGAHAFINRVPFSLVDDSRKVSREFISKNLGKNLKDYPDCIDIDIETDKTQGWVFANHRRKQYLPKLKFNTKYSIFTRKENVEFYKKQYPSAYIEEYFDLPCWFGNEKLHTEATLGMGSKAFDIKN